MTELCERKFFNCPVCGYKMQIRGDRKIEKCPSCEGKKEPVPFIDNAGTLNKKKILGG